MRKGTLLFQKYREFVVPTIFASASTTLTLIADGIIVGNMLNAQAMAAVNLCLPVLQALTALAVLIGVGASTGIAYSKGREQHDDAHSYFSTAIGFSIVLGLLLSLCALPFQTELAHLLAPENMVDDVRAYLSNILYGNVFMLLPPVLVYLIRVDGMARLSGLMILVANAVNIMLDVVFMGPCQMGIGGSSLATVCGNIASLLLLFFYARSSRRTLQFRFFSSRILRRVWAICKNGAPGAVTLIFFSLRLFLINGIVSHFAGTSGLIVLSVCMACVSLVAMFINGSANTVVPILGVLAGEEDWKGMRLTFSYALRFALVLSGSIVVLLEIFPQAVFAVYGVSDPQIIAMGIPAMRIFVVSLLGLTVNYLLIYYYTSLRRQWLAHLLSFHENLLFLAPVAYLFGKIGGYMMIWFAFWVAELMALLLLFLHTRWIRHRAPGRYRDFLLLDESQSSVLLDTTVSELPLEQLRSLLLAQGIADRAVAQWEEWARANQSGTGMVDVRVIREAQGLVMVLRDARKTAVEDLSFSLDHVSIHTSSVLGFCRTRISFH